MLTNEQIQSARSQLGWGSSGGSTPEAKTETWDTVMPRLQSLTGQTPTSQPNDLLHKPAVPFMDSPVGHAVTAVKDSVTSLPGKLAQDVQTGAADVNKGGTWNILKGLAKGAGRTAGDVASTVFSPISAGFGAVGESTGLTKGLTGAAQYIVDKTGLADSKELQDFATKHPNAEEDFNRILNLVAANGVKGDLMKIPETIKAGATNVASTVKDMGQGLADTAKETVSNIKDKVSGVKPAISEKINSLKEAVLPKKPEEIYATPESDLHKLNPDERRTWFENQKNQVTEKSNTVHEQTKQQLQKIEEDKNSVNQQIMQQHQANADALTKQAVDLQKELAQTSRDKVIELRPKIIKATQEQSKTYRSLVDEAMVGKEDVPVDKGELKDYVDARYGDDPGRAAAIKEKLGLTQTVDPMSTSKVDVELRQPSTTLGKIYEQTKSLRQDISKGAGKVFSPEDKLTDEAIHTLISFMKKNGIDLSEANQFWARYAPIRDQLAKEAKPFLQTGTQTKTFANTLSRVASGKDVNNENFINEVEHMLGSPITEEVKNVLSKLDVNQKQALANKVDTEMKKFENENVTNRLRQPVEETQVENKKQSAEQLKKLSDRQLEVERKAKFRTVLKKVLKYGLVTLGGGEVAKHL